MENNQATIRYYAAMSDLKLSDELQRYEDLCREHMETEAGALPWNAPSWLKNIKIIKRIQAFRNEKKGDIPRV